MTVTSCTELDIGDNQTYEVSLQEGTNGKRTYFVESDSNTDFQEAIMAGARLVGPHPLPIPLALWPGGASAALAHKFTPKRLGQGQWHVIVEYKTIFGQAEKDRAANEDPRLRPTRISGGGRTIMVPRRSCLRYGPYNTWPTSPPSFSMDLASNSAKDPLDPPVEVASNEWEIHCEKDVATLPDWFMTYQNGVNASDQIIQIQGVNKTIPAGCGKMTNVNFSPNKQENGYDFITLTWNVAVRYPRPIRTGETAGKVPSPWDDERLDEGMRERAPFAAAYAWKPVAGPTGPSVTTPVPFNGNGKAIGDGSTAIPETSLKFYCYRPFQVVDYSIIPWV